MQTATHTTPPTFVIQWELQTVEQMIKAAKAYRNYQTVVNTPAFILEAQMERKKAEILKCLEQVQHFAKSETADELYTINQLKKAILTL
jgi:hypothetical protein